MNFKIPKDIQNLLHSIEYRINKKDIRIKFTKEYKSKEILFAPFDLLNIETSLSNLETKVKSELPDISYQVYNIIEDIICSNIQDLELVKKEVNNNTDSVMGSIDINDHNENDKQNRKKKKIVVNKYSQNRKGELYESVLINSIPIFISFIRHNSEANDIKNNCANDCVYESLSFDTIEYIEENTRILIPPSLEEYLHNPYEFQSIDEIKKIAETMQKEKESIFSLYRKTKAIVSKYVDQEGHLINLIAIDIVFSYFSDRFSTVHYTGIFGANGSGKSSIGDIVEALGYRAVNTTDPSAANIFRSLGGIEPGQIMLVMDECDKIDQSPQMMGILKTGYDYKKIVTKVNQNTGIPEKFYAYCPKYIIGEKPPSLSIAYGVMDRTFINIVYYGKPIYDIKEILNPTDTGGQEYKKLYDELQQLRKDLFVYRLLHFKDKIKNIDIGIDGRNKELVKPYLQLFSDNNTEENYKTYQELQYTFQALLKIKNERKEFTIEAALLPLILQLMEEESKIGTITFSHFWENVLYYIRGKLDERKPNEYHTEDFGTIYRNSISNVLQKLGVTSKHHRKHTELIFDKNKVLKNASQYNISFQTKLETQNKDSDIFNIGKNQSEKTNELSGHCEDCEDFKTTNTKENLPCSGDISNNITKSGDNKAKNDEFDTKLNSRLDIITKQNYKSMESEPQKHSQCSRSHTNTSANNEHDSISNQNIFRFRNTDIWGCRFCRDRGDKWYMLKHPCRGTLNKDSDQISP
ncbi:hypothetical protein [Candidatus Nitrosocosmicus sp. SS]|jgi:hypothetical protein|uniref:hypothetical protein n=1 Tax=Candidatus Nitrosocosmicus agrestis TaxID=2563600 RepID=UPI00122E5F9C|nr:hypothetical protein [Candidatus Nitrosocosmicus sp. SS]KAA2283097.1 hypothetical protein F1Z66_03185 [Candidatus Nitrosocosmicus sp. SS]KAF0868553.1 hypothetical protein E5N71_09215 [Candidatus Nitrosocosmicus sp. SS]